MSCLSQEAVLLLFPDAHEAAAAAAALDSWNDLLFTRTKGIKSLKFFFFSNSQCQLKPKNIVVRVSVTPDSFVCSRSFSFVLGSATYIAVQRTFKATKKTRVMRSCVLANSIIVRHKRAGYDEVFKRFWRGAASKQIFMLVHGATASK